MLNFAQAIAEELTLTPQQINNVLELFAQGATIPFVARYRKELTGSLDEIQLRTIQERYSYLEELEKRKEDDFKRDRRSRSINPCSPAAN